MRRPALLCTVALLLPLFRTLAQEPGQRIRLRTGAAPSRWVVGTLIAQDRDSLQLLVAGQTRPVSLGRSAITRLEVSHGRTRPILEGIAAGFGLGFIVGANGAGRKQGRLGCPDGVSGLCALNMEADVEQEGLAVGAIGGLIGAAVGFVVRSERWERAVHR